MFDFGTFDNATFDFTAVTAGAVVGDGGLGPDPWKKKRRNWEQLPAEDTKREEYEELLSEVVKNFGAETQEILAPSESQEILTKPRPDIIQLWDEDDEEILLLL